jgi:hypothetical protein
MINVVRQTSTSCADMKNGMSTSELHCRLVCGWSENQKLTFFV